MAGATVGGGTRVNYNVSFRTPDHVRKEWSLINSLPGFTFERYDRAMDAVCSRLGVRTGQMGSVHAQPEQR
jgi:long-chain-alcohol oxidase